mmetsp:Transcript_59923/g.106596  ORF Transcript_59923/g.106596 Transcript_59923/m.106596 type:complete len:236 (+) Transcript_59923:1470-2177(+)
MPRASTVMILQLGLPEQAPLDAQIGELQKQQCHERPCMAPNSQTTTMMAISFLETCLQKPRCRECQKPPMPRACMDRNLQMTSLPAQAFHGPMNLQGHQCRECQRHPMPRVCTAQNLQMTSLQIQAIHELTDLQDRQCRDYHVTRDDQSTRVSHLPQVCMAPNMQIMMKLELTDLQEQQCQDYHVTRVHHMPRACMARSLLMTTSMKTRTSLSRRASGPRQSKLYVSGQLERHLF